MEFKFASHPKLTYHFVDNDFESAQELIFTVDEMEDEVVFEPSIIYGIYFTHQFDEEANDITELNPDHPVFDFTERGINIDNLTPGTPVSVFTIDGKLIEQTLVGIDHKANILLPTNSENIYIIKVGKMSFKVRTK